MKENHLLLAYATTSGSTQEIAKFVAAELTRLGITVTLSQCREVTELQAYSGVILGAPLYMFHLHKDATRFLHRHSRRLTSLPVAIFAGGPYGPNAAHDALEVRKNLESELAKFTWLRPANVQLVGGRFDPARLRFPYNLIPALKAAPTSDARDWTEIRIWAQSLPGLFSCPAQTPADGEGRIG